MAFVFVLFFALSAFYGPSLGGYFCFLTPLIAFVLVPILDWLLPAEGENSKSSGRDVPKLPGWFFDSILFLYVGIHLVLLFWACHKTNDLSWFERIGLTLSVGTITGGIGLTVSHELIHRPQRWKRLVSEILLTSVGYGHFALAHIHEHHRLVGFEVDSATAKKGQSIYTFWAQAICGSFLFAWRRDRGQIAIYLVASLVYALVCFWIGGSAGLGLFLFQSLMAMLLIESADYLEHYGIRRGQKEGIQARHSWDSKQFISGKLLFHLQRHSDHHLKTFKPYQALDFAAGAPQLPTGYPGMIWLTLIPPLFRRIMDPRI